MTRAISTSRWNLPKYWSIFVVIIALESALRFPLACAMLTPSRECAVVGVGVLGTSLCQQLLQNGWKVTGITKTQSRHDKIMRQVGENQQKFTLITASSDQTRKQMYPYCVFCAPPSGFDDYPKAVQEALDNLWQGPEAGGIFVFTSSGGIYGPGDANGIPIVTEDTPLSDPSDDNPRSARLMGAEEVVRGARGTVLRLAGLYTLDRGAHNFWLGKTEVNGRADGIINLLHYDDAAGSVVATLQANSEAVQGQTFLISDGHPLTRQEICSSSLKSSRYAGMVAPTFVGTIHDPMGKIYDGTKTNQLLDWKPKYPSFDEFMASSQQ